MDFCRNVSVPGDYHQQDQVLPSPAPFDDLFPAQNTEVDVSLEWLSVFVEDCLSSTGNCLPAAATTTTAAATTTTTTTTASHVQPTNRPKTQKNASPLEKFVIPAKARSKRRRVTSAKTRTNPLTSWSYGHHQTFHFPSSDPPLLQQTYWLADSELIMPKNGEDQKEGEMEEQKQNQEEEENRSKENSSTGGQARRCSHCLSQRTPQWRAGPLGPKTLCNACGVRYKSGRLLPEYRPAKSPTFVSYLHSNSHKKVLEMRMATSDNMSSSILSD